VAVNVCMQYRMGDVTVDALRDVNLRLPAGRFVVLVGPSGSGKTTLLNLAGGLNAPTSGDLTVFGSRLAGMSEAELTAYRRETVGFVFQMFNLVPTLTALEMTSSVPGSWNVWDLASGRTRSRPSTAEASNSVWPLHVRWSSSRC